MPRTIPLELAPNCPEREIMSRVMSRWANLVLILLRERTYRFSELRRRIGNVSEKMLAQALRTLEEDGFIVRFDHREVPPHVDYSLTPMGRDLAKRLAALGMWISDNASRVHAARAKKRAVKV
jgi:DNA-binding HxlR family transcriptional regulator